MSCEQTACRLIVDSAADGVWNMAVDEALLIGASQARMPVLRFYTWSEPTLSLGYFQQFEQRQSHAESRDCAVVRRASGGGAILHHHELTYSLSWPTVNRFAASAEQLYDAVHNALLQVLAEYEIEGNLSTIESDLKQAPYLCFERRAVGDVLLQGHKICGSAQRRLKGAVLQHGSLLLAQSTYTPQLLGVEQIVSKNLVAAVVARQWQERIAAELQLQFVSSGLSVDEVQQAQQIAEQKFGSESWLMKR